MRLDLGLIGSCEVLEILDTRLCEMLSSSTPVQCQERTPTGFEKLELNIGSPQSRTSALSQPVRGIAKDLLERPSRIDALAATWGRAFDEDSFEADLVEFASLLVGYRTALRSLQAVAVGSVSGIESARYPPPRTVKQQMPTLANLAYRPAVTDRPIVSAMIFWIYFYRLHPLPDGNGRTSRLMLNHVLRNYGVVSEPKLMICEVLFANLPSLGNRIRFEALDFPGLIRDLMLVLIKDLELFGRRHHLPK